MLSVLVKKEFAALTAFLTQNRKTGERRKQSSIVWMFVLYGFAMLMIGISVMVTFLGIADVLVTVGLDWFYFSLLSVVTLLIGVVGSAFSTYTSLYHAKDNEFLLSLPIKASLLLIARMTGVYLTGLFFAAIAWIPGLIAYVLVAGARSLTLLCALLLFPFLGLVILALSCLLGFLVALLASRVKNKTFFTMIFSVLFFGVYFWFFSQFSSILLDFLERAAEFGAAAQANYPLYVLGLAATGDGLSLLLVIACSCVLFALLAWILSGTYFGLLTKNSGAKKKTAGSASASSAAGAMRASSATGALLKREFRRFLSSPTYMLNCGMGLAMMLVLAVVALCNLGSIREALDSILPAMPDFVRRALPLFCALISCMLASTAYVSAPSVSLEGRQIWIAQSLPVETKEILRAKQRMHLILASPPGLILTGALSFIVRADLGAAIGAMLLYLAFVLFLSAFGLFWNLKSPNLNWTSEAVPIKQGLPVALTLFLGWLVVIGVGVLGFFGGMLLDERIVLAVLMLILVLFARILNHWIETRGAESFRSL